MLLVFFYEHTSFQEKIYILYYTVFAFAAQSRGNILLLLNLVHPYRYYSLNKKIIIKLKESIFSYSILEFMFLILLVGRHNFETLFRRSYSSVGKYTGI